MLERLGPIRIGDRPGASRFGGRLRPVAGQLRLAWPVFAIFLAQRLVTVAVLAGDPRGLRDLTSRWDAGWYRRLAQGGYVYPHLSPAGKVEASNLAYFPLYPWLARRISDIGVSLPHALLAVSWVGGLLAAWAIFAVGNHLYGRWKGIALSAVWGMAPASLALTMAYPEGLFTAAAAGSLLCIMKRRPVWAGVCAVVAGLLRPTAVAVIAVIGVYALVELWRWVSARRKDDHAPSDVHRANFPVRACVGAVVSTLGLGAFMIYVAVRTGHVFGYLTVQAQWGQRSASGVGEYWHAIAHGLFDSPTGALISVDIVVSAGYLLLFCLIVFDRALVWCSIYAAVVLVITLTHITFQHVYARQLLPAFVLLIPVVRMKVPRAGAILALTVGSLLMGWGSAQFLLNPTSGM